MLEKIQNARRLVREVREALKSPSPEILTSIIPALEQAISCLHEVEQDSLNKDTTDSKLRDEIIALRNDLRVIQSLIVQGAAIQGGLARILAAALNGYIGSGEPVPITLRSGLSIRG